MTAQRKLKELKRGRPSRLRALRRLLVFQVKLAADAVRDLLLSPISIIAFIVDAVSSNEEESSLHRRLMRLGQRSDRFINLFDEYRDATHPTIDTTLNNIETRIRTEQTSARGGEQKISSKPGE
ncbi:MAG: hypothetical protein ACI9GW_003387 [Halieaceae bacterium]|jgi:hypothetical protein